MFFLAGNQLRDLSFTGEVGWWWQLVAVKNSHFHLALSFPLSSPVQSTAAMSHIMG